MRNLPIPLLVWLVLAIPASAQGPIKIYLPIIYDNPCYGSVSMSDWKIDIPEATTNKALNPSGEITGNFAAEAGTTVTRVTTFQHYGLYSYRVETNANNEGIQFTLSALANAIHYVTVRVRGTLPTTWDWSLNGSTFTSPTLIEQLDSNWALYGLQFPAAQANGSVLLEIHQNGTGSGDFYLDGLQVEEKEYWTTYCDGTQEGCEWDGAEHASTSQRSAESRAGGRVRDLEDDFYLKIGGMSGTGTAPNQLIVDKYAVLPGGELNNIKIDSRVFTLTGVITGASTSDFHSKKQTLLEALLPDAYPDDENGIQPIRLRYNGATVHKEIAVHYDGGLEGEISASEPCAWERVAVRFLAPDPYWREIGESAALLDTNDSTTFRHVAARLKSAGQWSVLGPPSASGTYTTIHAIVEDSTYVYFGGDFVNFNNIANADYIVRYNKQTAAWSALGTGMNGIVYDLLIAPDGRLWATGAFTTAGGGAANRIAIWDLSAWATGGTFNNTGRALALGLDGRIYAGGEFTTINGSLDPAGRVAVFDTNWLPVSTGFNGTVHALAVSPVTGFVYAGGAFTTADGVATDYTAYSDPAVDDWETMRGPSTGNVLALAATQTGDVYAGGSMTGDIDYIAILTNGDNWDPLPSGVDDTVSALMVGSDGALYVGGQFTQAGDLAEAKYIARLVAGVWSDLDIELPTNTDVQAVHTSKKLDIWLGFSTAGTGTFAGKATVTNEGNTLAYPRIVIDRSGGTTAVIQTIRNERSGKELLFDYGLLDGETLTIDLTPTRKSITSSVFGPRPDAVLPNSDFGTWALLKDDNSITGFISESGSPTMVSYLLWKDGYKSQD